MEFEGSLKKINVDLLDRWGQVETGMRVHCMMMIGCRTYTGNQTVKFRWMTANGGRQREQGTQFWRLQEEWPCLGASGPTDVAMLCSTYSTSACHFRIGE
jgi:hypothetical protein